MRKTRTHKRVGGWERNSHFLFGDLNAFRIYLFLGLKLGFGLPYT